MDATPMMQWQMYGPGTAVAFSAVADASGIRVSLERDQEAIICGAAADTTMLLRMSIALRERLRAVGYLAKPLAERASVLEGGPCWGPAAPLQTCLIDSLR